MSQSSSQFGRNVFVLDISGSMSGQKCQTLQLSVTRIIEEIPDNSYVGIVLFDHSVQICHRVTQITDRNVRDRLIQSVPAMARGSTDIGRGILYGVQALNDERVCTDGATMFLVTDGQDGSGYVDRVLPTLLTAKIRVVGIAIGVTADHNLDRLSKETGGNTYAASGTNREMAARVIQATIQEVKTSKELSEVVNISVLDEIIYLSQSKVTKNVTIDLDIGRNTVFNIGSEDFDKISISIQSPKGVLFDSTASEMVRNQALKRYQFKQKTADPGVWTINLVKHSNHRICANLSVKSQPLNSKAIQMRVTLKDSDGINPPIIIAELRKGTDAVIGAEVIATIDKPDDSSAEIKLINYNNIYCNYFTDYSGSGRYNVTVLAHNKVSICQLNSLSSRGSSSGSGSVPQFERQMIAGCFKVTDTTLQRPSDNKLQELSLSSTFNSFSFNSSVKYEAPAPRTAKAVIKPKVRAIPQTDDIIQIKDQINNLLLVLKKSINSPKISDNERKDFKRAIEEIDFRSSVSTTSLQQLTIDSKKLEEIKRKLL